MNARNMTKNDIVKSVCTICPRGCGVLIHMEKDIPHKVEGDFENPLNKGKLCIKGLATLEYVYHPDRIRHPLMRSGEKGGGNWKQISWDQALDHVAEAFNDIKNNQGAESVAFIRGASKSHLNVFLERLANVFGSPNLSTMGQCCHTPRKMASILTCGYYALPDIEYPPSCIVVWGFNPEETFFYQYETILKAIENGSKLIVIDPKKTNLTQKADLWIQPRPGTDLALALGMINVMINEDCYDKDFVNKWTIGFDELKTYIQKYTLEKVEEITWVPRKLLKEMTINYAKSKPACIALGNAIEHNLNSFQTVRAVMILRCISGNLGVPGGEIEWEALPLLGGGPVSNDIMEQRVSAKCNILPLFKSVTPDTIIKAVLDEDPYPIRAAFIQGGNPLLTFPNVQNVYEAFRKLDFLVVADMFMTPTAVLADIILPAASFLEADSVFVPPQNIPIALAQRKVVEIGECWSDYKIIIELAKRLGLAQDFIWESEEQAWDDILKPSGLSFEKFKEVGKMLSSKLFRRHESKGFDTPSGKVEIYSDRLKKWGYDPIPVYYEPPETRYSEPKSFQKYPFILTSWKPSLYRHSWGHQINMLRTSHPEPIVLINPETGKKLDVQDGDWVYIETKRGVIKQKAKLESEIDARLIVAEFGWWYPERELSDLNRWKESNINLLTDDETPYARTMGSANEMGTPTLRGMFCNVYK